MGSNIASMYIQSEEKGKEGEMKNAPKTNYYS
jgi:hypothetical protein